jgi:predicted ATP-grasp superfamily ATP-dependent carboligase
VLVNTIVPSPEGLRTMAARWAPPFGVVLQEYIPPEVAEDWICNAWVGEDDSSSVVLTGVKFRMWPPDAGVATFVKTAANPEVAALSARIFEAVAYRGVADLDWRYDRRDGLYKLLDFNPRVGAQFRLFETDAGIDVVRAAHLDLTGRPIPAGRPLIGRSLTVEHLDIASRLSRKRRAQLPPGVAEPTEACSRSLAWFARDDLRPFFAMLWGAASLAAARLRPPRRARTAPAKASGNAPAPRLRQRRRQGPTRRSALRDERG